MSIPVTAACVYDVPLAFDPTSNTVKGFEPEGAEHRIRRYVEDSREWTLGPMPISEFMRYFLGSKREISTEGMLSSRNAFSSVPPRAATAREIYDPLIAALNKATKHKSRRPGFVFDNASANAIHPHELGHMKPHVCLYKMDQGDAIRSADPQLRLELGYAELFIEIAADPSQDFFTDPPKEAPLKARSSHDFIARSKDAAFNRFIDRALGQHISYVTEIFARQPRVFLFTVAMFGSRARLIRWDRMGCIVTESFDIRVQPQILCDFLWRFSQTSDVQRGRDPTVQPATPAQEATFVDCITAHVRSQLGASDDSDIENAVSVHYLPNHVSVIPVVEQDAVVKEATIRRYIVSRPVISPSSLVGKGTKGFWAVDVLSRKVVFLKDTWRTLELEGETLEGLHEKGVRNIPPVEWHGEVPDFIPDEERKFELYEFQQTVVDEYCEEPWVCAVLGQKFFLSKRVHYRFVLGIAGYGLKDFKGTAELLHATYDVFQAMSDARTLDSRIHRDISLGNIVLVAEPGRSARRGYLIDWDASCKVDDTGAAVYEGRAGTWEFMSTAMLDRSGVERRQTLADDMESLFYVVVYCAFLWLPHDLSDPDLDELLYAFFDARRTHTGELRGGAGKLMNAVTRLFTGKVAFNPALKYWVDSMMDLCWLTRSTASSGVTVRSSKTESVSDHPEEPPTGVPWSSSWTVENVDKFWCQFLDTHMLEQHDRVVHNHPRATGIFYDDVSIVRCPSYGSAVLRRPTPNLGVPPQLQLTSPRLPLAASLTTPLLPPTGPPPALRRSSRHHKKDIPVNRMEIQPIDNTASSRSRLIRTSQRGRERSRTLRTTLPHK